MKVVVSPAWYDEYVLTVGSVDPEGAPSRFTLAGPWVDVAAPGEAVVSLDADGEGLVDTLPVLGSSMPIVGTSYAAPVVSGRRACARTITAPDRATGHAADRGHRAPAACGLGSVRRPRRRRRAGRGQRRHHNRRMMVVSPPCRARRRPSGALPHAISRPDPSPRRVAFGGAGVCVAVGACGRGDDGSLGRSRRKRQHCRARLAHCPDSVPAPGAAVTTPARPHRITLTPKNFAVFSSCIPKTRRGPSPDNRTGLAASAGESRRPHIRASS